MPDYMTRYEDTERIEIPGGFWVDVKKCVTGTQMRKIRAKQITRGVEKYKDDTNEERVRSVIVNINADVYAYELAIASIVDWNFETAGVKWKLTPDSAKRANYDNLSEADQDLVEAKCVELNEVPSKKEAARFPVEGEGGLPGGQDQAPDIDEVRPGAEVVDAPGATPRPSPA